MTVCTPILPARAKDNPGRAAALALAVLVLAILFAGCVPRKPRPADLDADLEAQAEAPVLSETGEEISPEELWDMKRLGKQYRPLTPQEMAALDTPTEMDFQLDPEDNAAVQRYFEMFTQEKRELFSKWLRRAQIYLPYVRDVLNQYGLPHDLAILPFIESGYNPRAISKAKAGGMWQFIVPTSSRYGLVTDSWVDQRFDPYLSTHAAAKYLRELHEMFGDWYLALAAYNAGEGKISKALTQTGAGGFNELVEQNHKLARRTQLKSETRNYVPQFLAATKIVRNLEALGFPPLDWNAAPPLADLEIPKNTDLMALAKACGMSWEQFASYNPAFTRTASSPISEGTAHVPPETVQAAQDYLSSPQTLAKADYRTWKVRKKDTLKSVARKFGVSPAAIQEANHLKSGKLTPGHELLIPVKNPRALAQAAAEEKARTRSMEEEAPPSKPGAKTSRDQKASLLPNAPSVEVSIRPGARTQAEGSGRKPAATRQEPRTVTHTVQQGDTLYSLSRQYGTTPEALLAANKLKQKASLRVGQTLQMPAQQAPEPRKATSRDTQDTAPAKSATGKNADAKKAEKTSAGKSAPATRASRKAAAREAAKAKAGESKKSAQTQPQEAKAGQPQKAQAPDSKSKKPKTVSHEVRKGETLWRIAGKYKVSPDDLRRWNNLGSRDIRPGESLTIQR